MPARCVPARTSLLTGRFPSAHRVRQNSTEDQVVRDVILASQPNKRFVTLEELGSLTVFLCSPAAASVTGTAFRIDGGWTAR